jgi:hypothetical protein
MKKIISILLMLAALEISLGHAGNNQASADIFHLRDGRVFEGLVIEENADYLIIKTARGPQKLEADAIEKQQKSGIPQKYKITDAGVKDYLGQPVPLPKVEMDMIILTARQLPFKEREDYCRKYFDKAEAYENIVRMQQLEPEIWQSLLMAAYSYYQVALESSNRHQQEASRLGMQRCLEQLYSGVEGEFILPYTAVLQEYIEDYLKMIKPEDGRDELLNDYLEYAAEIINSAKTDAQQRQIAKNCLSLCLNLASRENLKKKAMNIYRRL